MANAGSVMEDTDADTDADKKLTLLEIKDYVDENVPYMARRLNNREQTPQLMTNDETKVMVNYWYVHFLFRTNKIAG